MFTLNTSLPAAHQQPSSHVSILCLLVTSSLYTVGGNILSQVLPSNKKTVSMPVQNNKR